MTTPPVTGPVSDPPRLPPEQVRDLWLAILLRRATALHLRDNPDAKWRELARALDVNADEVVAMFDAIPGAVAPPLLAIARRSAHR